jgi:Fe-S oxidoreductase
MKNTTPEIAYCTFCPKMCRFSCPVAEVLNTEVMNPTNKMTFLYLFEKKKLTEKEIEEIIFKGCIFCLSCQTFCKHKIDIPKIIRKIRSDFVKEKIIPSEVENFLKILNENKNPYNENLSKKLKELPKKYIEDEKEIVYFPGCTQIEYYFEDLENAIKIFEKIGIEFSILNLECCGFHYFNLGEEVEFSKLKEKNLKKLKNRKIISPCPECVYILKKIYYLKDVFHTTEFLYSYLTKDIFSNPEKIEEKIIYYDPCYLGRYLNIYEIPRNLIKRFTKSEVGEFLRNKEESNCCGYNFRFIYPEISKNILKRCLDNFKGGKIIVSCPSCKKSFQELIENEKVEDILSIVAKSI